MENNLTEYIKNMEGNLLGIGIDSEKLKTAITKNDKIVNCSLLEDNSKKPNQKKLVFRQRMRKVNIKKMKKVFKKKRMDNVVANYKITSPFMKTFIRDSIYLSKGIVYIYGEKTDLETVMKRYQRYTKDIKLEEKDDKFILIIDTSNAKNNKIKDIGYWWADTFTSFVDFLTLILAN